MRHPHARSITRRVSGLAAAAATLTMAAAIGLPSATAHDVVIGGTPESGEVVEEFPDEIVLEFSGIPQDSFNTVAVTDNDSGDVLFNGEPELDERSVILAVPDDVDPGAGSYTVGFQITSSDGHGTRGSIEFEVAGEASDASTDTAAAESTENPENADTTESDETTDPEDQLLAGPLGWVFGGVGVLVILGVLVMMIAKNRNNSQKE